MTLLAAAAPSPPAWLGLPFLILLLCLAFCPLLTPRFWERHHRIIISALGLLPSFYYLVVFRAFEAYWHLAFHYAAFMALIGSLFVVAGGIHVRVTGGATPSVNCLFLFAGALAANVLGTTGASMLLIRPWIRMNKYRFTGFHAAFFIFIISNVGGGLTPIGDPPLFLGYLKGVPFRWVMQRCWLPWLAAIVLLLAFFYVMDLANFRRAPRTIRDLETAQEQWRVDGWHNFLFMIAILAAVLFAPAGWRELIMLSASVLSYFTTKRPVHEQNHFNFGPVREVAWVFFGIFATMQPLLDYLVVNAGGLGLHTPRQFYWLTGLMSALLDNAPTYLAFLAAAFGLHHLNLDDENHMKIFLAQHDSYLVAISVASVLFGALTYIGNGPNLMVKAICSHARMHTPGFFTYIWRYSLPLLLPVLVVVGWLLTK